MKAVVNHSNYVNVSMNNQIYLAQLNAQAQIRHNSYLYETYKQKEALKDKNYKREVCNNYIQQGFCPYGIKCRFAHGLCDLIVTHTQVTSNELNTNNLIEIVQLNLSKWERKYRRLPIFEELTENQSTNENSPLNTSFKSNSTKLKNDLNTMQNDYLS